MVRKLLNATYPAPCLRLARIFQDLHTYIGSKAFSIDSAYRFPVFPILGGAG